MKGASGLFLKAVELVRRIRPEFFIWENVPGVLNINGGKDFATVLKEITATDIPIPERGFANAGVVDFNGGQLAYRILDAQYFGTPQRRKRIFLVTDFAGKRATKILFEPASLSGNPAPGEQPQQNSAARIGNDFNSAVNKLTPTHAFFGIGRDAFNQGKNAKFNPTIERDLQPPLTARGAAACATPSIVRRLTPLECERLQGLPDDWTQGGSDAKRYKALGNGMAQPIADWILKRVFEVMTWNNR